MSTAQEESQTVLTEQEETQERFSTWVKENYGQVIYSECENLAKQKGAPISTGILTRAVNIHKGGAHRASMIAANTPFDSD